MAMAAALGGVLLTLPGCGPTTAANKPLTIAYSDWPGWLVWEIAKQKDWCKEAGVDVKFEWYDYSPSVEAFSEGKADAVLIVCGDSLTAGKPSTAIVLTDFSDGNDKLIAKSGIDSV